MLHLAKSAEMHSTHNQLTIIWNQFAVNLRIHIPEPQASTTIGQFMDQVDSKTAMWLEMVQKSQQRQWHGQQAPQAPTPNRNGNDQKGGSTPYSGSRRFQHRLLVNDGKSHAYLTDVSPDGYAIYEEEEETNEHNNG